MASPSVEVNRPDAIPWWRSITAVSAAVPLIVAVVSGILWLRERAESAATELVAGRTAKVHLCEQQVGNTTFPCQTVLQYKALNPGPAQLQNVGLRVSVSHKKAEKIEDWLTVSTLVPPTWTSNLTRSIRSITSPRVWRETCQINSIPVQCSASLWSQRSLIGGQARCTRHGARQTKFRRGTSCVSNVCFSHGGGVVSWHH